MDGNGQDDTLETNVLPLPPPSSEPNAVLEKGTLVGRLVIVDQLGAGGMGVVYRAYDPELDRTIALKFLRVRRRANETERTAQTRLLREAQALARLAHPNVVAVHDVGTYETDVFIAMELVEGQTVCQWLAARKRSVREIVDIYLAAGRGLAAAHDAGLVHRDFKPANVVVGKSGRVRVLDFGLARAEGVVATAAPVHLHLPEDTISKRLHSPLTEAGAVMGTPRYMAPELLRQGRFDARTDQFAFAVSLYEALYGEWPFHKIEGVSIAEAVGRFREPPRDAKVPPYLLRILRRALATESDARYPTMDALLVELARDPSDKRRRLLTVVGLVAATLALGVAVVLPLQRRCVGFEAMLDGVWDSNVRRAVWTSLTATDRPYAADTATRLQAILDEYANAWVAMQTDACEATRIRGEQSDEMLDLRTACLGQRLGELRAMTTVFSGDLDGSFVDKAVEAASSLPALAACADEAGLRQAIPPPEDPAVRAEVDRLRSRLSEAGALLRAGQYGPGLEVALGVAEEAGSVDHLPLTAAALHRLGALQSKTGDVTTAEATLREAIQASAAAKDDSLAADAWTALLGVVGLEQARHTDALCLVPAAEAAVTRGGNDNLQRAAMLRMLGSTLAGHGKYDEALARFEEALALTQDALGPDHPRVALAQNNLAGVAHARGDFKSARPLYERSIVTLENSLGPDHPDVTKVLHNLAMVLQHLGEHDVAHNMIERVLSTRQELLGPDHPEVARSLYSLAVSAQARREYEESHALFERARTIWIEALGAEHPYVAVSLRRIGGLLEQQGRYDEAYTLYERALVMREKSLGPNHPHVATSHDDLGGLLYRQGRYEEARARHEKAVGIKEKTLGPDQPEVADSLDGFGTVLRAQRKLNAARAVYARALAIREAAPSPSDTNIADSLVNLGSVLLEQGEPTEARSLFERAVGIHEEAGEPAPLAEARFLLARALWPSEHDRSRALALARQAREAYAEADAREELARVDRWLSQRGP